MKQLTILFLALTGCALLLASCATAPNDSEGVFKFTVLRYKQPVPVPGWTTDLTQSVNPEGAALNIFTAMRYGNIDQWLASWDSAERPNLGPVERKGMLHDWQSLKDGRVSVVGRIIAGTGIIIELSVNTPQQAPMKVQLPLKREDGQWWLTAMATDNDYSHWETSTNKIVAVADTTGLTAYINSFNEKR